MSGQPDPKGPARVSDPVAIRRALLTHPECAACGQRASNAHHIVQRGSPHFGDDVEGNIVGLCGTGTMGCHGAIHGSPYVYEHQQVERWGGIVSTFLGTDSLLERRDAAWVAARVGDCIHVTRPDVIAYVFGKLGREPGVEFLRRFYPGAIEEPAWG